MLNVIAIIVSKMTSYRKGTVQMREESEILGMTQLRDTFSALSAISAIRKWEEIWFKTTVEDRERDWGRNNDVR